MLSTTVSKEATQGNWLWLFPIRLGFPVPMPCWGDPFPRDTEGLSDLLNMQQCWKLNKQKTNIFSTIPRAVYDAFLLMERRHYQTPPVDVRCPSLRGLQEWRLPGGYPLASLFSLACLGQRCPSLPSCPVTGAPVSCALPFFITSISDGVQSCGFRPDKSWDKCCSA